MERPPSAAQQELTAQYVEAARLAFEAGERPPVGNTNTIRTATPPGGNFQTQPVNRGGSGGGRGWGAVVGAMQSGAGRGGGGQPQRGGYPPTAGGQTPQPQQRGRPVVQQQQQQAFQVQQRPQSQPPPVSLRGAATAVMAVSRGGMGGQPQPGRGGWYPQNPQNQNNNYNNQQYYQPHYSVAPQNNAPPQGWIDPRSGRPPQQGWNPNPNPAVGPQTPAPVSPRGNNVPRFQQIVQQAWNPNMNIAPFQNPTVTAPVSPRGNNNGPRPPQVQVADLRPPQGSTPAVSPRGNNNGPPKPPQQIQVPPAISPRRADPRPPQGWNPPSPIRIPVRPPMSDMSTQTRPVYIREGDTPTYATKTVQVGAMHPHDMFLVMVLGEEEMTRMEIAASWRADRQEIMSLAEASQRAVYNIEAGVTVIRQELSSRTHIEMFELRQRETLTHHWNESTAEINMFLMLSPRRSTSAVHPPGGSPTTTAVGARHSLASHATDFHQLPLISPSPPFVKAAAEQIPQPRGMPPPPASPVDPRPNMMTTKPPPPVTYPYRRDDAKVYVPSSGYVRDRIEAIDRQGHELRPRRSPPPPPVVRSIYAYHPSGLTQSSQTYERHYPEGSVASPPPNLRPTNRSITSSIRDDDSSLREQSFRAMQNRMVNLQHIQS